MTSEPKFKFELVESDSSSETAFCTRLDGVGGMNVTALSRFCGTEQHVITELLNRVRDSDPIVNTLPNCLKSYAGREQRLVVSSDKNSLFVIDEVCHAVLEYYAFDARKYKGKRIAQDNYRMIAKAGLRVFIWSQTGYEPPSTQGLTEQQSKLIELMPGLIETVNQLQIQVQNLSPASNSNYMPPGWDKEVWNKLPPQDKRHFRFLHRRRRFRPSNQGGIEALPQAPSVTREQMKKRAEAEIQAAVGEVSEFDKQQIETAKQEMLKKFWDSEF